MSEHGEQSCFISWIYTQMERHPELNLLFAIPNGVPLSDYRGSRAHQNMIAGTRMNILKAEGFRPGVCDLFFPSARGGYFGMFIEMKTKTGRLSENQKEFIAGVEKQGYICYVTHGADEAIACMELYLAMPKTKGDAK